jgi:hypothetical protein
MNVKKAFLTLGTVLNPLSIASIPWTSGEAIAIPGEA